MAKKILVADDDPVVVETFRVILEKNGFDVVVARDGEECGRKLIMDSPDLVLLDIMMPKMDGYSFLISLKELKEMSAVIPDVPVIVITGREEAGIKEMIGKENIRDYIIKPLNSIEEFLAKINNILK